MGSGDSTQTQKVSLLSKEMNPLLHLFHLNRIRKIIVPIISNKNMDSANYFE